MATIPIEMDPLYRQGEQLFQQGRFLGALALFDEIERRFPDLPNVMIARARCMHALERNYEARLICNKLTRIHGDPRGQQLRARWDRKVQKDQTPPAFQTVTPPAAMSRPTPTPSAAPAVFVAPEQPAAPARPRQPSSPDLIRSLVEKLNDQGATRALYELCQRVTDQDRDYLEETLRSHESPLVRDGVIKLLALLRTPGSVPALLEALQNDSYVFARIHAAMALGHIGLRDAVPALELAARLDDSVRVRADAVVAIHGIVGAGEFEAFVPTLLEGQAAPVQHVINWLTSPLAGRGIEPPIVKRGHIVSGFEGGTHYAVYVPRRVPENGQYRVLFAIHGTRGTPESITSTLNRLRSDAEAYGLVVIAPYFDYPAFPSYGMLNIGFWRQRADLRVLQMVSTLSRLLALHTDRFLLFEDGPARGFASWFALAHPQRVLAAVSCLPRRHLNLDPDGDFPHGLRANPFAPDLGDRSLEAFLRVPLLIMANRSDSDQTLSELSVFEKQLFENAGRGHAPARVEIETDPIATRSDRDFYVRARSFLLSELEQHLSKEPP